MSVKHTKTSAKADNADTTRVQPSDWNAAHTVENDSISEAMISVSDVTTKNASTAKHGYLPKLSGSSSDYLNGVGGWSTPAATHAQDHSITSTSDHDFPGGTSTFLRADGTFAVPTTGAGSSIFLNVVEYGATGDGSTNDYTAINDACTAAAGLGGATVYFPAGIYVCSSTLTVPDHVNIMGEGGLDPATDATFDGSWLKGKLIHGSYNHISDIKIGAGGNSGGQSEPTSGTAQYVTYERVRFRGATTGATYTFGYGSGTSQFIYFRNCLFEAITELDVDCISVVIPSISTSRHYNNIEFHGCTFGAYNGSVTGNAGFDVEIVSTHGGDTTVTEETSGWVWQDCIFEMSNNASQTWGGCSLSAQLGASSTPMFVNGRFSNCLFKGNPRYGIALENGSRGWVISDNIFLHHGGGPIQMWGPGSGGHTISGNVFDSITNNGMTDTTAYMLTLRDVWGCTISNNYFNVGTRNTTYCIQVEESTRPDWGGQNVFSGNVFNDRRTSSGCQYINFDGGKNNLVVGNFFHTARADGRCIYSQDSDSTGNVVTANYFDNGTGGSPFYVTAGELIHYGNYYHSGTYYGVLDPVVQAAAAPAALAVEGAMYYNTADHKLYVRTNSAWVVVGAQS